MTNVIDFLESLGQDATLRHATSEAVEEALAIAQIDPALRAAILDKDQHRLQELLGVQTNVCCLVHAPEDDEEEAEEDDDDFDDDEGDKEGDDDLKSQRSMLRRVVTTR